MPTRLRPTAPIAADAVLVGDPGRALLLAQELLGEPKMCNHARGLWGYSGHTPDGRELTVQSTGIGAPSAVAVLTDLAELGARRAVRVGTCAALPGGPKAGSLLAVTFARAHDGVSLALGVERGEAVKPDAVLLTALSQTLPAGGHSAPVASFDLPAAEAAAEDEVETEVAADLQTAALLTRAPALGVAAAALLIVADGADGEKLGDEELEGAAKRAGRLASEILSG